MPTIRVCSCNGEWMNDWFTPDADVAAFKPTFTRDGHTSNTRSDSTNVETLGITPTDPNSTPIFTAVQEQLGLKLESGRGPVDVLVIDSVERPTPD